MTQEEFLDALADKQKVVNIIEKRLNMARNTLNSVYDQRARTIAETLKLKQGDKLALYINSNKKTFAKKGFFDRIIYKEEPKAFAIRMFNIKKDGTPYKSSESDSDAVNITALSRIEKI